jgi:hypothetical protein
MLFKVINPADAKDNNEKMIKRKFIPTNYKPLI